MADKGAEPFTIGGETIAPGTQADIGLPITTMATGFNSQLAVRVLNGARPGPTIFVSGAIHGDEIVGTAIIQRLANILSPDRLSGTVMLVPVKLPRSATICCWLFTWRVRRKRCRWGLTMASIQWCYRRLCAKAPEATGR